MTKTGTAPTQENPRTTAFNARVALQFIGLALLWGASYLFIKVSLDGLTATQVAVGRITLGAIFLTAVMIISRRAWPRGLRTWVSLSLNGVFLCVIPFLLYAWAGQFVPSTISSIYNATLPVAALLIAVIVFPDEKLTLTRGFGVLIAVAGLTLVAAPWDAFTQSGNGSAILAQVALLAANLCFAIGFVLSKFLLRDQPYDNITIAAGQITSAAAIGLALAPFLGGLASVRLNPTIIASMLTLGLLGTGLAYIWNNNIISAWGASRAATVSYLVPAVGVILGILVLREPLTWNEPVGGLLILAGILLSHRTTASRHGGAEVAESTPAEREPNTFNNRDATRRR